MDESTGVLVPGAVSRSGALVYDNEDEYRPEPKPDLPPLFWCDGSVRIGIHTSIAGDISGALDAARKLGCNAVQIFSGSPRMWPRGGSRISEADAERFRSRRAELALGPLVIHANYLINLAAPDPMTRTRSIQALHVELERAVALGADFVVVHPGSGCGSDRVQALAAVAEGLRQAARGIRFGASTPSGRNETASGGATFCELARGGLRILLENTSGMGAAVGTRFEELRAILDLTPELPLGVCLDTAHAFEAGYAIHTEAGLAKTVAALEHTVTLERVAVVHANDSKTAFGSRVDRHQHIGRGHIGKAAFARILMHPRLSTLGAGGGLPGRAFILETPIDAPGDDRRNVRTLWALVGMKASQTPRAADGFTMFAGSRVRRRKARRRSGKKSAGRRAAKKPAPKRKS